MEGLLQCSLETLKNVYSESEYFRNILDSHLFLEKLCAFHSIQKQDTFLSVLDYLKITETNLNINNLMVHYAKSGDLVQFKKYVRKGGNAWKESSIAAQLENNANILDYLFSLFTSKSKNELLAVYRSRKHDRLFGEHEEESLEQEFVHPEIITLYEGIIVGAILQNNRQKIKMYSNKVKNYDECLKAAVCTGSLDIVKYFLDLSARNIEECRIIAIKRKDFHTAKMLI